MQYIITPFSTFALGRGRLAVIRHVPSTLPALPLARDKASPKREGWAQRLSLSLAKPGPRERAAGATDTRHRRGRRAARCRHGIESRASLRRGAIATRLPAAWPPPPPPPPPRRAGGCVNAVCGGRVAHPLAVTIFIFIMAGHSPMIPWSSVGGQACRHTPSSRRRPSVSSLLVIIARTAGLALT